MGPGTAVRHAREGAGRVLRLLDDGRRALVRFEARPGVPAVVPVGQLERTVVHEVAPASASEAVLPWAAALEQTGGPDRQTLEALRLGVVPRHGLAALTVGRHTELSRLEGLLDRGRGLAVLLGSYGAGKSHMIELCEAEGRSRGMLVARASFDPVELPPSHPLRLYRALMASLSGRDGVAAGLRPLLERVEPTETRLTGAEQHRWLSAALFAVHHADEALADEVLAFVEARGPADHPKLSRRLRRAGYAGPPLLGLPDYRTFGQVMAHLLSGVARWTRVAGHPGLLVLLDEAEALDRLDRLSRTMADTVLRYLALAALDDADLAFEPDAVSRGGHAVHRAIDPRAGCEPPLAVVCAFTPNPDVEAVLSGLLAPGLAPVELPPLRPSLLPLLADKVYSAVVRVHPSLDPPTAHRDRVRRALASAFASGGVETPRQAARLVVEFWDLYRVDPHRALAALIT